MQIDKHLCLKASAGPVMLLYRVGLQSPQTDKQVRTLEKQVDFASRHKDAVMEALAELRKEKDVLVLMMGRLEDLRYTNEQFKQLTALISEAQMDYSLVQMKLYKANAEERLAKVRMSIVAQIVTEGRCTMREYCFICSSLYHHLCHSGKSEITLGVGNATRLPFRDALLVLRAPRPGRAAFSRGPTVVRKKSSSRHAQSVAGELRDIERCTGE